VPALILVISATTRDYSSSTEALRAATTADLAVAG